MKSKLNYFMTYSRLIKRLIFASIGYLIFGSANGQFKKTEHRTPGPNEVPVTGPGNYGKPGTTYLLMNNISSDRSAVFLGKDVTFDLNGYSIKYAEGKYENVPNSGFEEGDKGWDLSKAPGAKVVNTEEVHVFVGKKLMSLKAGDEIVSPYINLPVANRSYFALCGVTGSDYHEMGGDLRRQMMVSVYVEDENGKEVNIVTRYGDTTMVSCPVEKKSPHIGGGFIFAHLNKLPAGKYRVRVKAENDCLVDEIDIRPGTDVGIGIVEKTHPMGHFEHLHEGVHAAFFDYTENVSEGKPVPGIPRAEGYGTVTIKNGHIESGSLGTLSWGIQSTADNVKLILDNVDIKTAGLNATAIDVPQATITNCRFDVDNPFIMNRHGSSFYGVDIRGNAASEVSFSAFYGGQGCLVFKGNKSSIHHNYFVNRQMVTNHYSVMAMGDSSKVFNNLIEPEVGSGIEIYRHNNIEIFNNTIKVTTSPPTCEYGHEEYSVNAIRLADYNAKPGSEEGAFGNKIYNNNIQILAVPRSGVKTYVPMSYAIYYSASGGVNEVFGNNITVEKRDTASNVITAAFYICGGTNGDGGKFYNNRIYTNVPAAWVASMYGGAANTYICQNTIIANPSGGKFNAFRIGWSERKDCFAKNVEFRSNVVEGASVNMDVSDQEHTYSVYWTLSVHLSDKKGKLLANKPLTIYDANKTVAFQGKTDDQGNLTTELPEYFVDGRIKKMASPYTVKTGKTAKAVLLNKNTELSILSGR